MPHGLLSTGWVKEQLLGKGLRHQSATVPLRLALESCMHGAADSECDGVLVCHSAALGASLPHMPSMRPEVCQCICMLLTPWLHDRVCKLTATHCQQDTCQPRDECKHVSEVMAMVIQVCHWVARLCCMSYLLALVGLVVGKA